MKYVFVLMCLLFCSSVQAQCARESRLFGFARTERVRIFVREGRSELVFRERIRESRILPRNWGK